MRLSLIILFLLSFTQASTLFAQNRSDWYRAYLEAERAGGRLVLVEFAPSDEQNPDHVLEAPELGIGLDTSRNIDPHFFGLGQTAIREVLEVSIHAEEAEPLIRRAAGVFKIVDGRIQRVAIARTHDQELETVNDLAFELPVNRWAIRPSGLSRWIQEHSGRKSQVSANLLSEPVFNPNSQLFSSRVVRPVIDFDPEGSSTTSDLPVAITALVLDRFYSENGELTKVLASLFRTELEVTADGHARRDARTEDPAFQRQRTFVDQQVLKANPRPVFSFRTELCRTAAHELASRERARR